MGGAAANRLGNLLGSVLVALMYYYGGGSLLPVDTSSVHSAALAKTTAPAEVLFFKGCCATGWFAGDLDGDPRLKAPPSSSPFGGACWPLSPRVTNTPSPT